MGSGYHANQHCPGKNTKGGSSAGPRLGFILSRAAVLARLMSGAAQHWLGRVLRKTRIRLGQEAKQKTRPFAGNYFAQMPATFAKSLDHAQDLQGRDHKSRMAYWPPFLISYPARNRNHNDPNETGEERLLSLVVVPISCLLLRLEPDTILPNLLRFRKPLALCLFPLLLWSGNAIRDTSPF
jgi:hypothetical protein